MNGPIPKRLLAAFDAQMQAADSDNLPDGAWFAVLKETAERFMRQNKLPGDGNDATHQYIQLHATEVK